jgi:hypothetical protein
MMFCRQRVHVWLRGRFSAHPSPFRCSLGQIPRPVTRKGPCDPVTGRRNWYRTSEPRPLSSRRPCDPPDRNMAAPPRHWATRRPGWHEDRPRAPSGGSRTSRRGSKGSRQGQSSHPSIEIAAATPVTVHFAPGAGQLPRGASDRNGRHASGQVRGLAEPAVPSPRGPAPTFGKENAQGIPSSALTPRRRTPDV